MREKLKVAPQFSIATFFSISKRQGWAFLLKATKKKDKYNASLSTRLTADLELALKGEAKKGITMSALINNVLSRYMLWVGCLKDLEW